MLGRVEELFSTDLQGSVIGSPEFCNYKIKNYFTKEFWAVNTEFLVVKIDSLAQL